MKGSPSSASSSSSNGAFGLSELSLEVEEVPVGSSATLWVESRDRTCGAFVRAREGDDDVDKPGTFERRRLDGVLDA